MAKTSVNSLESRLKGLLLGTAVGDALGLPAENLSRGRIRRLWNGDWQMRLVFGRGMISDDTEHTLMVAQALLSHPDDALAFQRSLAGKFRWWFVGLPGGVGHATAKACLKLWLGFSPLKSAVTSAGSGPAMRSAIIGAYFTEDPAKRRDYVLASARITHRGWQAETAALAIAEAAAIALESDGQFENAQILSTLRALSGESEWHERLSKMELSLGRQDSVSDFARSLGLENGVTGYSLNVVPVALYSWLRHRGDFRSALISALECGGDTDTVGAIVGALCGATGGSDSIPQAWVNGLADWPRSVSFIQAVAEKLANQKPGSRALGEVKWFWVGQPLRNIFFLIVVLFHGFRRGLPPY